MAKKKHNEPLVALNLKVPKRISDRLEAYIGAQENPTTKVSIACNAIERYLDEKERAGR